VPTLRLPQQIGQKGVLFTRFASFGLPLEMALNDALRKVINNVTMWFHFIGPELEQGPLPAEERTSGRLRDGRQKRICKAVGGML
jgi:hypothetical protein